MRSVRAFSFLFALPSLYVFLPGELGASSLRAGCAFFLRLTMGAGRRAANLNVLQQVRTYDRGIMSLKVLATKRYRPDVASGYVGTAVRWHPERVNEAERRRLVAYLAGAVRALDGVGISSQERTDVINALFEVETVPGVYPAI